MGEKAVEKPQKSQFCIAVDYYMEKMRVTNWITAHKRTKTKFGVDMTLEVEQYLLKKRVIFRDKDGRTKINSAYRYRRKEAY